jgi:EmrB/QacA subfamily drug resistance transporter
MSASSITPTMTQSRESRGRLRDRRGIALAIVLCAQLMVIIDMTVVNIALPSIGRGLNFSVPSLSWVLNAYTLTFGGLLLLGGRAGDILGRRRVFIAGIAIFTAASLAGGLATSAAWLLAARAVQGAGGAIASPAALALITAEYSDERDRSRAIGLYAAVAMGGASLGLVLGGVITEWLSWRWVLFVNVPIGITVALVAPLFVRETARRPGRFDFAGALTSTAGLASLVYAFTRAASHGWGDLLGIGAFATAALLLGSFVVIEMHARQPITPLRLFADRARSGSYLARLLVVAGMFGMFFFLTLFVQKILGFSPLRAGVAFIPMTAALFAVSRTAPRLIPRFGPTRLMVAGLLPVIAGMTWLTRISPETAYVPGILGPMLAIGCGMGLVFVPLTMASLAGVRPEDSGAASSMVNVMQQVGGSLGLAILVTVFGSASRDAARSHPAGLSLLAQAHQAATTGMATAFTAAAIFDVFALAVILTVIRTRRARQVPAGGPAGQ